MASKRTCNFIKNMIIEQLHDMGIANQSINLYPGSVKGDNYGSIVTRADIQGTIRDRRTVSMYWIAKCAAENDKVRETLHVDVIFPREIYVYKEVLPVFETFQSEKAITDKFYSYPKYIDSTMEPKYSETVMMENMKAYGYKLKDKSKLLDLDHVLLAMREYGRLHALSFALRAQKPQEFNRLATNLEGNLYLVNPEENMQKHCQNHCKNVIEALDPEKDQIEIKKVTEFNFSTVRKLLLPNAAGQYGAILHGDSWMNNVLFKYEDPDQPEKPTNICFLDFQLSHVGSVAFDLLSFIFTSTDKNLRDEHYDAFLKTYHASFCSFTRELDSDPNVLLPYDMLLEHLKHFAPYGFMVAMLGTLLMTSDADELPNTATHQDCGDIGEFCFEPRNRELYNNRIRGVVKDFVRLNYL